MLDDNSNRKKTFEARMQLLFSLLALKKAVPRRENFVEIHFAQDADSLEREILVQRAEEISRISATSVSLQTVRDDLKAAFPHGVQVWIYSSIAAADSEYARLHRQAYIARARLFCAAGSLVMRWVKDKKQQAIYLNELAFLYQKIQRDSFQPSDQEGLMQQFQKQLLDYFETLPDLSFIYRPHVAKALQSQESRVPQLSWPWEKVGDAYREAQRAVQQDILILSSESSSSAHTCYEWEYVTQRRTADQREIQPFHIGQGSVSLSRPLTRIEVGYVSTHRSPAIDYHATNYNDERQIARRYGTESDVWSSVRARAAPLLFGSLFFLGTLAIGILIVLGLVSLSGWGLIGLAFCGGVTALITVGTGYREYQSRQAQKQITVEDSLLQFEELEMDDTEGSMTEGNDSVVESIESELLEPTESAETIETTETIRPEPLSPLVSPVRLTAAEERLDVSTAHTSLLAADVVSYAVEEAISTPVPLARESSECWALVVHPDYMELQKEREKQRVWFSEGVAAKLIEHFFQQHQIDDSKEDDERPMVQRQAAALENYAKAVRLCDEYIGQEKGAANQWTLYAAVQDRLHLLRKKIIRHYHPDKSSELERREDEENKRRNTAYVNPRHLAFREWLTQYQTEEGGLTVRPMDSSLVSADLTQQIGELNKRYKQWEAEFTETLRQSEARAEEQRAEDRVRAEVAQAEFTETLRQSEARAEEQRAEDRARAEAAQAEFTETLRQSEARAEAAQVELKEELQEMKDLVRELLRRQPTSGHLGDVGERGPQGEAGQSGRAHASLFG